MEVTAAYAKANLLELLKAVERGERVTISHYNTPIADLVPTTSAGKPSRKFGTGKGRNLIIDPNWDRAIETGEELEAFFNGEF
jgi:prevent-host-death family protein